MRYEPEESVTPTRVDGSPGPVTSMVTPGSGPPDSSVARPAMDPEGVCAAASAALRTRIATAGRSFGNTPGLRGLPLLRIYFEQPPTKLSYSSTSVRLPIARGVR